MKYCFKCDDFEWFELVWKIKNWCFLVELGFVGVIELFGELDMI